MYYTLMYQDEVLGHPTLLFTSKLDISWIAASLNDNRSGPGFFDVVTSEDFGDYGRDEVREYCRGRYADN